MERRSFLKGMLGAIAGVFIPSRAKAKEEPELTFNGVDVKRIANTVPGTDLGELDEDKLLKMITELEPIEKSVPIYRIWWENDKGHQICLSEKQNLTLLDIAKRQDPKDETAKAIIELDEINKKIEKQLDERQKMRLSQVKAG